MKMPPISFLTASACLCLLTSSLLGQGIVRVKDINIQPASSNAFPGDSVVNVNGTLFLATDDNLSGSELWKSDGTLAGTVLVKDIVPGTVGSNPGPAVVAGVFVRTTDCVL